MITSMIAAPRMGVMPMIIFSVVTVVAVTVPFDPARVAVMPVATVHWCVVSPVMIVTFNDYSSRNREKR
jgi:hypothetical protein